METGMDHQAAMKLHPLTLRFTGDSSNLEAQFSIENIRASLPQNRVAMVTALFFYSIFGILDVLLMPEQKSTAWFIRYAVVAPMIVVGLLLSYTKAFERYVNPLVAFGSIVAGGGIICMIITATPLVSYVYYAGIVLVLMWTYTFARIPFLWATFSGWVLVVLYEIAAVWISQTPFVVLLSNNFFFISANIIGMIACYSLEYSSRSNFFLTRQIDREREKTAGVNRELECQKEEYRAVNLTLEQEVSERRRAEETLTRSEAQYRLLAENVHDSILTLDLDLRFTYASPSVMRLTGYSPQEIMQLRVEQLFTPESYALARQVLSEELARNRQPEPIDRHVPRTLELELLRKDGDTLWIELTTTFIWDDQARPVNILVVARDISKRKQAEGERERLVRELQQALADVKTLRGLIPICASCKKIRDDQGYWKQIEGYISEHSDAVFSHGICPECMEKLYPGFLEKKKDAAPTPDPAVESK